MDNNSPFEYEKKENSKLNLPSCCPERWWCRVLQPGHSAQSTSKQEISSDADPDPVPF
jgi:hypothetical protein